MKKLFSLLTVTVLIFSSCYHLHAQNSGKRDLLHGPYTLEKLQSIYTPGNLWNPFPTYNDRAAWAGIPDNVKKEIITAADKANDFKWTALPASLYLDYSKTGNRSRYEAVYFKRRDMLADLVLGELITGNGKYLDQIANGIWAICEETSWTIPAHIGYGENEHTGLPRYDDNVVALFSAETGTILSWTYYFFKDNLDKISPEITRRMEYEINRRVLSAVMARNDYWWMGLQGNPVNNWNPWIISNWITCDLIMEKDNDKKIKSLEKAITCLDNFLNQYPEDGGCDEGPGYWSVAGGSLFDCLDFLYSSSNGAIDIYGNQLVKNIGDYICKAYIAGNYFIDFADASAITHIDPDIVFRFGEATGNSNMMGLAAAEQKKSGYPGASYRLGRDLYGIYNYSKVSDYPAKEPLIPDFWLQQTEIFGGRSVPGSVKGLYLAGKGGNNAESHNHNDVGNFIVYMNGEPAIIDVGVETYRKETFSDKRYTIWTMQSQYHNLPTVNGVMQKDGASFRAKDVSFNANKKTVNFSLDISGAYPPEAGLNFWKRSISLLRGKNVTVTENFSLKNNNGKNFLTLMTPCMISNSSGKIELTGNKDNMPFKLYISYNPSQLSVETEKITIDDNRLKNVWGTELYRIKLNLKSEKLNQKIVYTISQE